MNEITRIHLARTSYEVDITAKKDLEKYLIAIKKSLGDEIDAMEDIEIRMTEILADRGVVKDSIITESDVAAIKSQLGEPTSFSSDDSKKSNHKSKEKSQAESTEATKKYFRDSENSVLGGVVSGLSAYTGWDVTLLRILAVILTFFSAGFFIILYIVVWICAPEATTTSEKLEMRGEPVNIDSIKESAKNFGAKAEKAGKNVASKTEKVAQEIATKTTTISNALGRALMVFCGIIGLCVVFSLLIALIVASNAIIGSLAVMDIVAKPVIITAASLGAGFGLVVIILFSFIVVGLLTGKFSKGYRVGIITTFIISLILLAGAIGTASSWYTLGGTDSARQLVEEVRDDYRQKYRDHGELIWD